MWLNQNLSYLECRWNNQPFDGRFFWFAFCIRNPPVTQWVETILWRSFGCIYFWSHWSRSKNTADNDACYVRQRFGLLFLFGLVWQYSSVQTKYDSNSWLLTCSSNITLSLLSDTGTALKRELYYFNNYLSLLYFCIEGCQWR